MLIAASTQKPSASESRLTPRMSGGLQITPHGDATSVRLCYWSCGTFHPVQPIAQPMSRTNSLRIALLPLALGASIVLAGCSESKNEAVVKFEVSPDAVRKTITANANGVAFAELKQESKKNGRVIYEAKGKTADGRKIEIKVEADGRLVKFQSELDD